MLKPLLDQCVTLAIEGLHLLVKLLEATQTSTTAIT